VKLWVTTLVGAAVKLGAVGGVNVIVVTPVPVTVAACESRLSIFTSWTMFAVMVRTTPVRVPNAGSCLATVADSAQFVVVRGTLSQTVSTADWAAAG
jgi:hypothetical protein